MTTTGLPSVERVIASLSRFPGIGRKSAQRMVQFLLKKGAGEISNLTVALEQLRDRVRSCRRCFNLAEDELCWVCSSAKRNHQLLCVLEEPSDLLAIERAGLFTGVYHVLGGRLSPIDGIGPSDLHIAALESRLRSGTIQELIIATNPTVEGEVTGQYLAALATPLVDRITRLAYGLPMGGELEYLDESTLYQALAGRRDFNGSAASQLPR
ncbi:MAG: recombination protein RecR [Magnetococcales bacterium]|nr:recombination protein RecR [Magnetococcales bacterium]